jgi:hypothetical protein
MQLSAPLTVPSFVPPLPLAAAAAAAASGATPMMMAATPPSTPRGAVGRLPMQASVYYLPSDATATPDPQAMPLPQQQQQQQNGRKRTIGQAASVPVFKAVFETGGEEFVKNARGLEAVLQDDHADVNALWLVLKSLHHTNGCERRAYDEPTELAVIPHTNVDGDRVEYYAIYSYGYTEDITLDDLNKLKQQNPTRVVYAAVSTHAVGENTEHSRGAIVLHLTSRSEERASKRRNTESALMTAVAPAAAAAPCEGDDCDMAHAKQARLASATAALAKKKNGLWARLFGGGKPKGADSSPL